jgi:N-acetyl-anhydromuramyl-L-alanine amidase AmpD
MPAPQIVKRAGWKAKPPKSKSKLAKSAIDELVVHYTAMGSDQVASHADCAERVRSTQRYHQSADPSRNKQPWSDISYNWIVCHHGVVFQGRGWDVMSAATLGHNDHTQAVCFLGGDRAGQQDFTPQAEEAVAWLVSEFFSRYPKAKRVVCHSDRSAEGTTCPGDEIRKWVNAKGWKKTKPAEEDGQLPAWLIPWVEWQLGGRDPAKRPKGAPKKIPAFAWDFARNVERIARGVS